MLTESHHGQTSVPGSSQNNVPSVHPWDSRYQYSSLSMAIIRIDHFLFIHSSGGRRWVVPGFGTVNSVAINICVQYPNSSETSTQMATTVSEKSRGFHSTEGRGREGWWEGHPLFAPCFCHFKMSFPYTDPRKDGQWVVWSGEVHTGIIQQAGEVWAEAKTPQDFQGPESS